MNRIHVTAQGMRIAMLLVDSSWIDAMAWNGRDLYLLTSSGRLFCYQGARDACREYVPGESIGAWYNAHVKGVCEGMSISVDSVEASG